MLLEDLLTCLAHFVVFGQANWTWDQDLSGAILASVRQLHLLPSTLIGVGVLIPEIPATIHSVLFPVDSRA